MNRTHAWTFKGDCDPTAIVSNTFTIEWLPKSGQQKEFPEIDRAESFDLDTARRNINAAQVGLLDELEQLVNVEVENRTMDRQEALTLLNAKLDGYRRVGYDELAARVGEEEFPEVVGPSGTQYQMEIQIIWDSKPGGDVRVLGSIDDGGWRAFVPLCDSLLMTPQGERCE